MYKIPITFNEYYVYDDYAEILIQHERLGVVKTKIDIDDIEKCRPIKWLYNEQAGYVYRSKGRKANENLPATLQRFLMNTPIDKQTDHVNGDRLDNRKSNLRFVTPLQNQWNTKKIGVSLDKRCKGKTKYRAYIAIKRKQISLGSFDTYEEACRAREEAEVKYYGEYRRINKFDFLK